MKHLKYFVEQVKMPTRDLTPSSSTRVERKPNQYKINKTRDQILKTCPKGINPDVWLSLTPERRAEVLRNKKTIEDKQKKGQEVIDPNKLEQPITSEQTHDLLSYSSLAIMFLPGWGLAISSVLDLIHAGLYFKEGNKNMGWFLVILSALPAVKWVRLGMVGKATLGAEGLKVLIQKISYKEGKFIINKGSKLTLEEKRFLLAVIKNIDVALKNVAQTFGKESLQLTAVKRSWSTIIRVAAQFIWGFGGPALLDPEMDEEEQLEAKTTIEEAQKSFVKKGDEYEWVNQSKIESEVPLFKKI